MPNAGLKSVAVPKGSNDFLAAVMLSYCSNLITKYSVESGFSGFILKML